MSAEEEKAQSAIDDIFAEIKPVNTSGEPAQQMDAAQLFDFGSSDTAQGVAQQPNIQQQFSAEQQPPVMVQQEQQPPVMVQQQ